MTGSTTRDEILRAAAHLLVTRGYRGTSTRDIAAAVDIRQPSLFHHFESKRAIFAELLESDLLPAVAQARYLAELAGPAAPRLIAHVIADHRSLAAASYDVRGIYTSELLDDPDFREYKVHSQQLNACLQRIVQDGVDGEEFRAVRPAHAQQAIAGMFYGAVWANWQSEDDRVRWPEESAEMLLRGLLRRPSEYAQLRRAAEGIIDAIPRDTAAA
jgi:AcrR family transcriptional regulator